jgi:hypothetical protein
MHSVHSRKKKSDDVKLNARKKNALVKRRRRCVCRYTNGSHPVLEDTP